MDSPYQSLQTQMSSSYLMALLRAAENSNATSSCLATWYARHLEAFSRGSQSEFTAVQLHTMIIQPLHQPLTILFSDIYAGF